MLQIFLKNNEMKIISHKKSLQNWNFAETGNEIGDKEAISNVT